MVHRNHLTADSCRGADPLHAPCPRTRTSPTRGAPVNGVVSDPLAVAASTRGDSAFTGPDVVCGSTAPRNCRAASASTRPYWTVKGTAAGIDGQACSARGPGREGADGENNPAVPATTG